MFISTPEYFLLFISAFGVVAALTPIMRQIAVRKNFLDLPSSSHKSHKIAVPYLGGVAILIGVVIVTYLALLFSNLTINTFILATSVLAPAVFMGFVGLWDDKKNLPPFPRFISQSITGIIVAVILIINDNVATPTNSKFVDFFFTTFWVVAICNSINFFDNLDGGAAGTIAISALFLVLIAINGGQHLIAALSVVILGSTIGFLFWNRYPARIHMGDAGALFLGVLIATLTIRLKPTTNSTVGAFATPLLILAIPILDTSVAVLSRLRRRVSPFRGGTDHLSHRLIANGLNVSKTARILWILSALFCLSAFIINLQIFDFEIALVIATLLFWLFLFNYFFNISINN